MSKEQTYEPRHSKILEATQIADSAGAMAALWTILMIQLRSLFEEYFKFIGKPFFQYDVKLHTHQDGTTFVRCVLLCTGIKKKGNTVELSGLVRTGDFYMSSNFLVLQNPNVLVFNGIAPFLNRTVPKRIRKC